MALFTRVVVVLCWITWGLALLVARRGSTGRTAVKVDPVARLGNVLQVATYVPVLFGGGTPNLITRIISIAFCATATVFTWWAVRHLRGYWKAQASLFADHKLVQTGPYRILRHPIYFSMLLLLIGTHLGRTPWPIFAVCFVLFVVGAEIRTRSEDRLLAGRFGEEFQTYRSSVSGYIPFIR